VHTGVIVSGQMADVNQNLMGQVSVSKQVARNLGSLEVH